MWLKVDRLNNVCYVVDLREVSMLDLLIDLVVYFFQGFLVLLLNVNFILVLVVVDVRFFNNFILFVVNGVYISFIGFVFFSSIGNSVIQLFFVCGVR